MIFRGDGVVWDIELQKELCAFERQWDDNGKRLPGIYETDDPNVIRKLRASGYIGEGDEPKSEPVKEPVKEEKKVEVKKEEKPKKVEFPMAKELPKEDKNNG